MTVAGIALVLLSGGAAHAADRIGVLKSLTEIPAACADCTVRVELEGVADDAVMVGQELDIALRAPRDLNLLLLHVDSHGVTTVLDHGRLVSGVPRTSAEFEASEPVGTDTLIVLTSTTEIPLLQSIEIGTTYSSTDALQPLVAALKQNAPSLGMTRVEYAVEPRPGTTTYTVRGVRKRIFAPPTADMEGSVAATPAAVLAEPSVVLPVPIEFATDSSQLDSRSRRELDVFGDALVRLQGKAVAVQLIGHTDEVGDALYNQKLSERRAQAAHDYLIQQFGIPGEALPTTGRGESQPAVAGASPEARRANRRVEFSFVQGR